jgi:hypothetical protein
VQIPPHDKMSARRVPGLEAAVVDNDLMVVASLEPDVDTRVAMPGRVTECNVLFCRCPCAGAGAGRAGRSARGSFRDGPGAC